MEIDLSNRIALITGASGQLGRTMVRTLASCGAAVAIHYHANEKSARQLQAECAANGYRYACSRPMCPTSIRLRG